MVALAAGLTVLAGCSQNPPAADTTGQGQTVDDSAPLPDSAPPAPTTAASTLPLDVPMYTVEKGDTVAKIAAKMNVDTQLVIDANGIANPDKIKIGQKLRVPAGGTLPGTGQIVGRPVPTTAAAAKG